MNIIQKFQTEEKENFGGNTKDGTKPKSSKTWNKVSMKKKESVNKLKNKMIQIKAFKSRKQETQAVKMKKIFSKMINQKILKICKSKVEENNMQAMVKEEEKKLKMLLADATKC